MRQVEYLKYIAESNFIKFMNQGYATAGHNGPHGHIDTPIRNTSHYLIIYAYLYKKYNIRKYKELCDVFASYLLKHQKKSLSGAIKCMESGNFDQLNGLIGQAWVIEALVYYYGITEDRKLLNAAISIFNSQEYDYHKHLWIRIGLNNEVLGYDNTLNHQIWFAACATELIPYVSENSIKEKIDDFILYGLPANLKIYRNGLLKHNITVKSSSNIKASIKKVIKFFLSPLKKIDPRKFDYRYIEKAYHIFDVYGLSILEKYNKNFKIFNTLKYTKAIEYSKNIKKYNRNNLVYDYLINNIHFNIYSYSYNSPAFEFPFVAAIHNYDLPHKLKELFDEIYDTQLKLMYNNKTKMFSKNNPDLETWNAKCYEIIRYLEL